MRTKESNKQYQAKWYKKNREVQKARVARQKRELHAWLWDLKSGLSCSKCGQNHPATLDFHHRDSDKKDSGIAAMVNRGMSKEKILVEMSKCDILCSNCHRILHYEEKCTGSPIG